MEEKRKYLTKIIVTLVGGAFLIGGLLLFLIRMNTTPNYEIGYNGKLYSYNSSYVDNNNNFLGYSKEELGTLNESKNGYLIDLNFIKNDNDELSLNEEYIDLIFKVSYETTSNASKYASFEIKNGENTLISNNKILKGTYTFSKINIKDLKNLELIESKGLTLKGDDSNESVISFSSLDFKIVYYGR